MSDNNLSARTGGKTLSVELLPLFFPKERFRHLGFELLPRDHILRVSWLSQLNLRHPATVDLSGNTPEDVPAAPGKPVLL